MPLEDLDGAVITDAGRARIQSAALIKNTRI